MPRGSEPEDIGSASRVAGQLLVSMDGSALTSQGRETDVFVKDAGGVWKLLHVDYSGMPTTNLNRGF